MSWTIRHQGTVTDQIEDLGGSDLKGKGVKLQKGEGGGSEPITKSPPEMSDKLKNQRSTFKGEPRYRRNSETKIQSQNLRQRERGGEPEVQEKKAGSLRSKSQKTKKTLPGCD